MTLAALIDTPEDEQHLTLMVPPGEPLLTVSTEGLWEVYLGAFADPAERQYHTCSVCRHFIERFGGLVTVDAEGHKHSALWPGDWAPFAALRAAVEHPSRQVDGVFVSSVTRLGLAEAGTRKDGQGVWTHIHTDLPESRRYRGAALSAAQHAAEKREDVANVRRALGEFPLALLEQAAALLRSDALYRAEKVLGPVEWLRNLRAATEATLDARRRSALVWRAVAAAPAGFCHPRASMAGTLLEDLAAGLGFEDAARRFKAKMHPLQYQRPQAAPTDGQLAAAEVLVAKLGVARALERRFARLDEIETVWRPQREHEGCVGAGGVFGHLLGAAKAAAGRALKVPQQNITWARFAAEVLPSALRIEALAPAHGAFAAFTTAEHADAPQILQWANPFAWYLYHGGSTASSWGLAHGWRDVLAVAQQPPEWVGDGEHQGRGALFVLAGCADSRDSGNALFPECLRADLHGIRAAVEAYSRRAVLGGRDAGQLASGLLLQARAGSASVNVRVHVTGGISMQYTIDRWA